MKNTTVTLLMALGLALPTTTFGQNADSAPASAVKPPTKMASGDKAQQARPANERRRSIPTLIAAIDVNHDGVLDATEIANAPQSLRKLDENGDGILTGDELRSRRASRPRPMPALGAETGTAESTHRPPTRSRLGALDVNHDGVIDAAEISGASQVLAKLDKDGDGKVTLEELRSQRAKSPRASRLSAPASKE